MKLYNAPFQSKNSNVPAITNGKNAEAVKISLKGSGGPGVTGVSNGHDQFSRTKNSKRAWATFDRGGLSVSFSEAGQGAIELFDSRGKLLHSARLNIVPFKTYDLALSHLTQMVHFRATLNGEHIVSRIIKIQ